ncbi:alpha/beta fold hydrolase [Paracoccus sp. FO-3]|uniref:alpha/beta hydrolase n=1 Tax=Paracoccus sp. FO-3 TaxID=1335059 RepID=UPI0015E3CE76|nr:alpha/beta fold hydrolase [Paracoccus sp. FO-3]
MKQMTGLSGSFKGAVFGLASLIITSSAVFAQGEPMTIVEQGSFFVGGHSLQAAGEFDAGALGYTDKGQTFWKDQMYVQYQIPADARKLPIVLVHGGGGTGRVWETTPDGREGYQTIFLRRGFPVYIVDAPRRGRSGYPSYNGPFGQLDGDEIIPNRTQRAGIQYAWSRWRIGPKYPEVFPVQQFDVESIESFIQHLVPDVNRDPDAVVQALVALLEKIGPAILVTHSESGIYGWKTATLSDNVKGIVSYEPGFVFPEDSMPDPIPLFEGEMAAGSVVSNDEFAKLANIPIQIVYGDNIPSEPIPDIPADGRRAQVVASQLFADSLNGIGGNASILSLPSVGLFGNSHFMFSDLNNLQVADQLSKFLAENELDQR